jgi:hypothetical protein
MKTEPKSTPIAGAGFWRSPSGANHGRDSRPGDVWVEPGDITDTDRIDFLVAHTHYKFWVHHPDYVRTRPPMEGKLFASEGVVVREVIDSAIKWMAENKPEARP